MSYSAKREKENLQRFKKIIRDMINLLRSSLQAETVSLHWINNIREVFVLESYATIRENVMFQDRVGKKEHFLNHYDTITAVTRLEIGNHIGVDELEHYTSPPSGGCIYLIPFIYNAETVAITCVESFKKLPWGEVEDDAVTAYNQALGRLLQTYLELSDLTEKQLEWTDYDEVTDKLAKLENPVHLALFLLEELQGIAGKKGGVLLLARGMEDWHSVLYSEKAWNPPPLGLPMQERSISEQALTSGKSIFSTHINASPKRISVHEPLCHGASMAVPVMHNQRRQLLVLVYLENPLIFTETVKYKINNLCRIAGLKIEAMLPGLDVQENIFSTAWSSFSGELFSGCLSTVLKHIREANPAMETWVGMAGIGNIAELRTKYRLEDLVHLQKQILSKMRPQNFGCSGIIGEYSDYVYTFILQSTDETAFARWTQRVKETFDDPVVFSGAISEVIQLNIGYTTLDKGMNPDIVMQKIKKAMNKAIKEHEYKVGA